MVKTKLPKGLGIINKVMDELHSLIEDHDLHILKNTIINVSEAIKEEYEADVSEFKILTSQMNFIIDEVKVSKSPDLGRIYHLIIFPDNKVGNLEQLILPDLLDIVGIDFTKYEYLSKCTFHFNKLYYTDQFHMIPSIKYGYKA